MTDQITTLEKLEQVSAEITAIETDRGIAWAAVHALEAKVTALKEGIAEVMEAKGSDAYTMLAELLKI